MSTDITPVPSTPDGARGAALRAAQVILVTSSMLAFISYWRLAAIVLCDLAGTAYFIGGIVESSIGPAAPFFILAVMLFSYAVRSVYLESCSLFVRGGVYKVVKEAMGGFLAKLSVSALLFDYILTGPTSGVSAGQYIVGLVLDTIATINPELALSDETRDFIRRWGAVAIACAITVYFFRQNLIGIRESSGQALKIMVATGAVIAVVLVWGVVTLLIRGQANPILRDPELTKKYEIRTAARFKVTPDTLTLLEGAGVPAEVRSHLKQSPLFDREFDSRKRFREAAGEVLRQVNAPVYLDELVTDARVVERYEWTPPVQDTLAADGVPQEVLAKLAPLADKTIGSTEGFRRHALPLLSAEEWQKYGFKLQEDAAVVLDTDRVTGDKVSMWERDPDTLQLVPRTGVDGQPVPKMSEAMRTVGVESQEDPLGALGRWNVFADLADHLRNPRHWLSLIGLVGLGIAFGHSILAMSGEETLAQVYREVEAPKMKNFKKAALVVFVFSVLMTGGVSFLAVLLIPDEVRMKTYSENLIGGLAMYLWGHVYFRLALNLAVVMVGFLILAGAVNTAIIGSNGVLNRVSEDGVLPDWFLKPHHKYGTTYRLLYLITALQLATILLSRGDMIVLGEAYAFGVVWSFVFKALAMVVLRFRDRSPREYMVPLNVRVGGVQFPIGLSIIFLALLFTAVLNFFTKEVATVSGIAFTLILLVCFMIFERTHRRRDAAHGEQHLDQFNQETAPALTPAGMGLTKPYRKLVCIRTTKHLSMLELALDEADPDTTSVVVMTAKVLPPGNALDPEMQAQLDRYDQELMTAVVQRVEKAGKEVRPLIVPTNDPLHALLQTARDLQVHELVLGASDKVTVDKQLADLKRYWQRMQDGAPMPLAVRILTRDRDLHLDLGGCRRIPKISERRAHTAAELRAAGVGVRRVLLLHEGGQEGSDLFETALTLLDPGVPLTVVLPAATANGAGGAALPEDDAAMAARLGRKVNVVHLPATDGPSLVRLAKEQGDDLLILPVPPGSDDRPCNRVDERAQYALDHAHCRVLLASTPTIPDEVLDIEGA